MLLLIIRPLINGIWLGFTETHLLIPESQFIGLKNYVNLFTNDRVYWKAFFHTIIWTVSSDIIILTFGLILAILLNLKLKGIEVFRTLVLIPWILPVAIVALIWELLYWQDYGVINFFLKRIGIISENIRWLTNTKLVLFACVVPFSWWRIPFATIMLLAGLQVIPSELYEAAEVDGANSIKMFIYITFPLMEPILMTVLLVTTIWAVGSFPIVWILTGGGPANSSELLSTFSYATAFNYLEIGYAAAIADTMLLLVIPVGFFYLRRMSR